MRRNRSVLAACRHSADSASHLPGDFVTQCSAATSRVIWRSCTLPDCRRRGSCERCGALFRCANLRCGAFASRRVLRHGGSGRSASPARVRGGRPCPCLRRIAAATSTVRGIKMRGGGRFDRVRTTRRRSRFVRRHTCRVAATHRQRRRPYGDGSRSAPTAAGLGRRDSSPRSGAACRLPVAVGWRSAASYGGVVGGSNSRIGAVVRIPVVRIAVVRIAVVVAVAYAAVRVVAVAVRIAVADTGSNRKPYG